MAIPTLIADAPDDATTGSDPMRNLTIDSEQHCCPCGALCEQSRTRCQKCRARFRWYRRKAWRVNSARDTDQTAAITKEVINR
jgi:hypothetical protein